MKNLNVSFENLLDYRTRCAVQEMLANNLIDYQKEHGIITELDKKIDKLKRLVMKVNTDNELLFCIRIMDLLKNPDKQAGSPFLAIFDTL